MSEDKRVHRGKRAGAVYTTGAGQAMREGPEDPRWNDDGARAARQAEKEAVELFGPSA
jgi:hypothetical protein